MKRSLILLGCLFLLVMVSGCQQKQAVEEVTFEQLFASPQRYDGKDVCLEGFYFHGFELIVLSERLETSGYAPGHLVPRGEVVWIEGGIPMEIYDQLHQQAMMGIAERYGKLKICGKFEYGGQYGHLGGYNAQITLSQVELLPWSPP